MADEKIVTKKTAAKPAATTKKAPVRATRPAAKKAPAAAAATATKKTATRAASPSATPRTRATAAKTTPAATTPPPGRGAQTAATAPEKKVVAKKAPTPSAAPLKQAPPPASAAKPTSLRAKAQVSEAQRQAMIREAAYYIAERRGFAPGSDAEDWANAEKEVDALLAKSAKT